MSAVGYDFGNLNSVIAAASHDEINVLCNDFSIRATSTCVAAGRKRRFMGVAAKEEVNTNLHNTKINFKHLLGRKFSDPIVQLYRKFISCEMVQTENDGIGLKVNFLGEFTVLSPEQIAAAFFVKLKQITEQKLGTKINECMISVPTYFSKIQANALKSAGQIAGLNFLDLVKENEAVGIAYGLNMNASLPSIPIKLVVIVDVGYSSAQASLMIFSNKQVEILYSCYDIEVGGLFFDDVIREHFYNEFLTRFNVDAKKNPKAWLRLLDESEKAKKQMSTSSMNIPLSIECFMDDTNVSGTINRNQFEEAAKPLFQRLCVLLDNLLNAIKHMGIRAEDIPEVQLIGGSSQIPKLKQIVGDYFGKEPKSTMIAKELVARGVAMQCAIVSPTTKIKKFEVVKKKQQMAPSDTKDDFSLNIEECITLEDDENDDYDYSTTMQTVIQAVDLSESQKLYCNREEASHDDYASKLSSPAIGSVIEQRQDVLEKQQKEENKKEQCRVAEKECDEKQSATNMNNKLADKEKTVKKPSNDKDAAKENDRTSRHNEDQELPDAVLSKLKVILNKLTECKYAGPFAAPVDGAILPEYYELVDNPMDLGTMRLKLDSNKYTRVDEFLADIKLILSNCFFFNDPLSEVFRFGLKVNRRFNQIWPRFFPGYECFLWVKCEINCLGKNRKI